LSAHVDTAIKLNGCPENNNIFLFRFNCINQCDIDLQAQLFEKHLVVKTTERKNPPKFKRVYPEDSEVVEEHCLSLKSISIFNSSKTLNVSFCWGSVPNS
jgi:hypothetical protein